MSKIRAGKLQKKILEQISSGNRDIKSIIKKCMDHHSVSIRAINALIDRKIIYQNNQELMFMNMKQVLNLNDDIEEKRLVWEKLKESNNFQKEKNYLLIQSHINFIEILHEKIIENESLKRLKNKNEKLYFSLISSLEKNIEINIERLQRKVYTWSNQKLHLDIKEKKMILKKNEKVLKFKDVPNCRYILECIIIINNELNNLNENTMILGLRDYSSF